MGGGLYFWFMKDAVYDLLKQGSYVKTIHAAHILAQGVDPASNIYPMLDSEICRTCSALSAMSHRIAERRTA
jgi:SulP family sulfate permease